MTEAWRSGSRSFSAFPKVQPHCPFPGKLCPQPCPWVLPASCGRVTLTGCWLLTQVSSEHVLCLDSAPLSALTLTRLLSRKKKSFLFRLSFLITTQTLKTKALSFLTVSSSDQRQPEPERAASSCPARAGSSGTAQRHTCSPSLLPPVVPPRAASRT